MYVGSFSSALFSFHDEGPLSCSSLCIYNSIALWSGEGDTFNLWCLIYVLRYFVIKI